MKLAWMRNDSCDVMGDVDSADSMATGDPSESLESNLVGVPLVRASLSFLARKTGLAEWLIEESMRDVAYSLGNDTIRKRVLEVIDQELRQICGKHQRAVVIGHSLGSVVAYDVLTKTGGDVPLFVTAGSPLGLGVVQNHLRGTRENQLPSAPRAEMDWVNPYDKRDIVGLINPLSNRFGKGAGIKDELTYNSTGAHSISDYLADPDVAEPIGRALQAE